MHFSYQAKTWIFMFYAFMSLRLLWKNLVSACVWLWFHGPFKIHIDL